MNTTLLILLISLLILFILIRIFLFLVQVEGWSMYPTYQPGDRLLALRYFPDRWLRRGRVVVWKMPPRLLMRSMPKGMGSKLYIKRIIGLPGQEVTVPVVQLPDPVEGVVWMDEAKQELKSWHIPAGHCFVKGDSPGFDSTFFGSLPLSAVRGLILVRLPRRTKNLEQPYLVDIAQFPHSSQEER
jgi:signal peptidase I